MVAPGVYPRGGPRPTTSHAEQSLHRALAEALPEGWIAWHSLRVRADGRYEGETDFVVAIPTRGLLILEVKGGAIEIRGGLWCQNGKPMRKAPRDQALRFAAILRDKLRSRGVEQMPWVEVATVFPDTPFSIEPSEGAVAGAVVGQQNLPSLRVHLVELTDRLFERANVPRDESWLDVLHKLWCETWTPSLRLGDRTRLREQELVALDRKQLALLDSIADNPRLLVQGGAGTGKTLVAREIYQRMLLPLAEQGREPLYLCSTNALAAALRALGTANAWTVREYAADLLAKAEVSIQGGAHRSAWTPETWDLAPLQAAIDAVPMLELRHGAVVVDEGQDMAPNDWELVRTLAGDGVLWIFADVGQSFWTNRSVPAGMVTASFTLVNRYRCPEPLARFADLYRYELPSARPSSPVGDGALTAPTPRPSSPVGATVADRPSTRGTPEPMSLADVGPFDELCVVRIPSSSSLADKVANEIQKALGGGVRPSDIAVLSLAGQTRTKIATGSSIGSQKVVRADDAEAAEKVIADTFLRFKGLERPWIIVTELSLGTNRYDVRMHLALTRATVRCIVVATGAELEADPRLRAASAR